MLENCCQASRDALSLPLGLQRCYSKIKGFGIDKMLRVIMRSRVAGSFQLDFF